MSAIQDAFRIAKDRAEIEPLPSITGDDTRKAARKMKAGTGLGIDRMMPVDFERRPSAALDELSHLYILSLNQRSPDLTRS